MKQVFLALGMILTAAGATFAHTNADRKERREERTERKEARNDNHKMRRDQNRINVSYFTRNSFERDFPAAKNVQFVKANNFDEVFFTADNNNLIAYYDNENKLVGTTQRLAFSDLPANVQKEIHKKYAGYDVEAVVRFVDDEINETDMILYGTPFDDEDNYFVELKNNNKDLVIKVNSADYVTFFKDIK